MFVALHPILRGMTPDRRNLHCNHTLLERIVHDDGFLDRTHTEELVSICLSVTHHRVAYSHTIAYRAVHNRYEGDAKCKSLAHTQAFGATWGDG